jgi:hypothetical protein
MPIASGQALSVDALFAERDAQRRHDREALEQMQRRKEEELVEFRARLNSFRLTDEIIESGLNRIKRAFERGETELMIASFPSTFCTDDGRGSSTPARRRSISQQRKRRPGRQRSPTGCRPCRPGFIRFLITGSKT